MLTENQHVPVRHIVLICLLAFIGNLFCNHYSPLFCAQGDPDTAIFYMTGKAWAHGMVPYIDFADVKGPLLILLYGVGYLISPDMQIGCYLLFSGFTAATLYYLYKSGRVLGLSPNKALMLCALALFALLEPENLGGRAENLQHPFMAAMLYGLLLRLQVQRTADAHARRQAEKTAGITAGLCFAAALLIKFNNIIPACAVAAIILYLNIREKNIRGYLAGFCARFLIGSAILILPIVAWMCYRGCMGACIEVYYHMNALTAGNGFLFGNSADVLLWRAYRNLLQCPTGLPFLTFATLLLPGLFGERDKRERMLLLLFIAACYVPNLIAHTPYYMVVCAPLFCLCGIPLLKKLPEGGQFAQAILLPGILFAVITHNGMWKDRCTMRLQQAPHHSVLQIEDILATVPSPRVIYYSGLDVGYGMRAGALPGSRCWCCHNGLHELCHQYQHADIRNGNTDFIICTHSIPNEQTCEFFRNCGYSQVGHFSTPTEGPVCIFRKTE